MNDYEKLSEELDPITDRLDGLSVPDEDIDKLIYQATELLKKAHDMAAER